MQGHSKAGTVAGTSTSTAGTGSGGGIGNDNKYTCSLFDKNLLDTFTANGEVQWPPVVYDSLESKSDVMKQQAVGVVVLMLVMRSVATATVAFDQLGALFLKICLMYGMVGFLGGGIDALELKYHWAAICNSDAGVVAGATAATATSKRK